MLFYIRYVADRASKSSDKAAKSQSNARSNGAPLPSSSDQQKTPTLSHSSSQASVLSQSSLLADGKPTANENSEHSSPFCLPLVLPGVPDYLDYRSTRFSNSNLWLQKPIQ